MRKLETLFQIVSVLRSVPDVGREQRVAAYEVQRPVTVYVRASHCRVRVQRTLARQVQIQAELRQSFGWDWVTERDEAGIYVVLKRKPLVGALSTADLTLIVPPDAYLVFHLTPGSVTLHDFEGRLSVAPIVDGPGSDVMPAQPADSA